MVDFAILFVKSFQRFIFKPEFAFMRICISLYTLKKNIEKFK